MLNRVYLIGSVWGEPKVLDRSGGYGVSFLLAVYSKQKMCGQPPHKIGRWYSVVAEDDLGGCCDERLRNGYMVYVEGKARLDSKFDKRNDHPADFYRRCHIFADSVMILSKNI